MDDIDLDSNFYYDINNNCCYYSKDQYNRAVQAHNHFSIIHFNSRSLNAHLNKIQYYLSQFKQPFNIVSISEMWIWDFKLDGSEFNDINNETVGGGVAIYVDKNLNCEVMNDIFEWKAVEIYKSAPA